MTKIVQAHSRMFHFQPCLLSLFWYATSDSDVFIVVFQTLTVSLPKLWSLIFCFDVWVVRPYCQVMSCVKEADVLQISTS